VQLLMVVSHQMEDIESLGSAALLRRAGLPVELGTFESSLEITTAYGTRITADTFIKEDITPYDGLIIPGGKYVKETVDADTKIKALATAFKAADKYLMAICAGPRFLMQADLIDGDFTNFPGAEVDQKRGTYHSAPKAMVDGKLITARSAGAVYDFVFAIIETLQGEDALQAFKDLIKYE